MYVSTFLSGLVELPAYVLTGLVIDRIGRRIPLALFMVIAGVSCMACQFVPSETLSLYLALLGKLCIAGSFSIIYIHSSELFPTVVRNSGVGLCSSSARVGGVVASYFVAGSVSNLDVTLQCYSNGTWLFLSFGFLWDFRAALGTWWTSAALQYRQAC